ncbi:hypothetical protein ACTFIV_008978 [Dictyostelium citrinum]
MDKRIENTKSKINSPEFQSFNKVKKKRIRRQLKNLEITKKKFEKIRERANKNRENNILEEYRQSKNESQDMEKEENENEIENDDEEEEDEIKDTELKNENENIIVNEKEKEKEIEKKNENEIKFETLIKNNNNSIINKYYSQRYRLFSKYDEGIILDQESWFSVTPELIAQHIAERCSCNTLVDLFCGAGGNTIQFSFTCNAVISVDLDPMKLLMAKHNSWVYGHSNENTNIEFINSDAMNLSNLKADVIFLSPPWGGPNYTDSSIFHLDSMIPNGFEIFKNAIKITPNVVYFLPKNTSKVDIAKLALISKENGGSEYCEIEENYINEKLKTITLYFGSLINNNKIYESYQ